MDGRFVDYDRDADHYHRGRRLGGAAMTSWASAVRDVSGGPHRRILDLGAGTGIFTSSLGEWLGAEIAVAVDSSEAMLSAASARLRDAMLVADAHHLPLRARSIDVVWMSAVYHHLDDKAAALTEQARVLTPEGTVLVRTLLRDRCTVPWLTYFSPRAQQRALARFPSIEELSDTFAARGLALAGILEVKEGSRSASDAASWILQMRDRDSLLTAMTDDEIATAVSRLRVEAAPLEVGLTLLAFKKT